MAITRSQSREPASTNNRIIGRFLDDATTPAAASLTPGFIPRYAKWVNLTDRITYEWWEGMASGTTLKSVAAGTRTLDTADAAISVSATTGVVTIAAAVVIQNKQYQWVAEG